MGYDLTMTKIKKSDLDKLKSNFPELSIEALWDEMLINYYSEKEFEEEYGEEALENYKEDGAIFCEELVYTNRRAFRKCPLINNAQNGLTIAFSAEEAKKLFQWLDTFLRTEYLDNIEEYYGIAYDTVYYQMSKMIRDLKEDDIVIFHHDW